MTQAIADRCNHFMLPRKCVVPGCRNYDRRGRVPSAETRPKPLLMPIPDLSPEPRLSVHPGAAAKRSNYWRPNKDPETSPIRVLVDQLAECVAREYSIGAYHILSKARYQELVEPRQVLYLLCRNATDPKWSYPSIGRAVGGRDHTTVMSGINAIKRKLHKSQHLRERLKRVLEATEYYGFESRDVKDLV